MSSAVRGFQSFLSQLRAEFRDFRQEHGKALSAYLALVIIANGRYCLEIPEDKADGSTLRESIVGGVSVAMWQLQLSSATAYAGEPVYYHGIEIGTNPVYQHCTAEGYDR